MSKKRRTSLEQKWDSELAATGGEPESEPQGGAEPDPAVTEDAAGSETQLQSLHLDLERAEDQLLRQKAEMANYRRRMQRELEASGTRARAALLGELLPVVDDLDRAVGENTDNMAAYRAGVELILRSLHETLERLGVERIEPLGELFDPHRHEAVEHMPTDAVAPGHVARVYKPGYVLGERLVRPAVVAVAAEPVQSDSSEDAG